MTSATDTGAEKPIAKHVNWKQSLWVGVVPCFNEAKRIKTEAFLEALRDYPSLTWVFVNDGSVDQTSEVLKKMQLANPDRIHTLNLEKNQGKAEAVRHGMLFSKKLSPWAVGYFDADLATPIPEFARLAQALAEIPSLCILGSRMFLKGRKIQRSFFRYFLGRCFLIPASLLLKLRFHDTQCGAKLFVWTPQLEKSLAKPFVSKWLFDIELIQRLKTMSDGPYRPDDFFEEPLRQWTEIGESKVKPASFVTALWDLVKIFIRR